MAVARADALRTKAAASITNLYTTVGSVLAHNWREFKITNNTDGDLFVSFDGTTDNLFLPAGSFELWDLSANAPPLSPIDNLLLAINTQFYVKYNTMPTTGDIWITGFYARGE